MIKLIDILEDIENKILVPRRSPEERQKNYQIALQKKIQQYIKGGSKGHLFLNNTPITYLPDNLKVGGGLSLSNTSITHLPDNLQVGGGLYLTNTSITHLPNNLKVGGDLYLANTKITYLPNNLKVGGGLFLNNTPITSLPDNLQVGGYLDLDGTKITYLPNNLQVGGGLYLTNTPLSKKYSKEEIRQMVPNVKGEIFNDKMVETLQAKFKDTYIQNQVDTVSELIYSTKYKIENLG